MNQRLAPTNVSTGKNDDYLRSLLKRMTGSGLDEHEQTFTKRRKQGLRSGRLSGMRLYFMRDRRLDKLIRYYDLPDSAVERIIVKMSPATTLPDKVLHMVKKGDIEVVTANGSMRESIMRLFEGKQKSSSADAPLPNWFYANRLSQRYLSQLAAEVYDDQ